MSSLTGRVALVTGAASGIGAAVADALAGQGDTVYRSDVQVDGFQGFRLDVRDEGDWDATVARVLEERGRLDALVHCAGISSASPLPDTPLGEWRRVLSTNLDGSFLALKHGVRAMRERGGAIVVIGSASGIRPSAGAAAYSTSKAGVAMLVRAAAKECKESGIPVRINAVSPAGVRTPMWSTMPFFRDLVEKHGSEAAAFTAMEAEGGGRFAEPEDVARSVLFLLSDEAGFVTGVELPVDDGYTL